MNSSIASEKIKLKRAYELPSPDDGTRVLVDRLWPRGLSKEKAALDQWMKDIAPSTELRKWFGHDPARWKEFRKKYTEEINQNPDLFEQLRSLAHKGTLTLIYSAHDEIHNDAVVLQELLIKSNKAAHERHR